MKTVINTPTVRLLVLSSTLMLAGQPGIANETPFPWQQEHARATETGDIVWTPKTRPFEAKGNVRYIDYEHGSDANDGASTQSPWKHHPWDDAATAKAADAQGVETAVFKCGTVYRGKLMVKEKGQAVSPIRLTRDPSWGKGPAILAGSEKVAEWTQGSDNPLIPDAAKVWKTTLDFAPRALWRIDAQDRSVRIPLARHPNWKSQPEDHKAQWFAWTNEPHPFKRTDGFSANDSKNLAGLDPDFVNGALIYSEFGWVMGTPYPSKASNFDPKTGAVKFERWTGGSNAEIIFRNMRYYLEDKPQYLDDPEGEFWFDKKGDGGTLYLRLPDGMDPRTTRIEAAKRQNLIEGANVQHLDVCGLDFRWTSPYWDLDVVLWDFTTRPWGHRADATPACIRVFGKAEDVRISNCTFEDVAMGIRMEAVGEGSSIRDIMIDDNAFRHADVGAILLSDGAGWGFSHLMGELDDIDILRNSIADVGFRASRYERGCAIDLHGIRVGNIAGNRVTHSGAQGINVVGGKASGIRCEVPLIRILIHQNKVWKTMQNANDFGGIESWQHGPVYIFNNLSFDARGQWEGRRVTNGGTPGFGHAYYLDGGFKNYLFNNIAWGLSNDPSSPLVNCSAFQEIHSYQNLFMNNTAYNYTVGSRRQAPHAGSNKFLGNVWQDISERVFRHADPAKTQADGNAADAGEQKEHFAYGSNAYADNVFFKVAQFGVFEVSGRWLQSLEDFSAALKQKQSLVSDTGVMDARAPLRNPAQGDFKLNPGSAAVDRGSLAFVPWALYGVVAEWNFYPAGNDAAQILDEHWAANDYLAKREDYHARPTYPLTVVNAAGSDYVAGPLENFTAGALKLDPARKLYATLSDAKLKTPYTVKLQSKPNHGQDPGIKDVVFQGSELKTAEVYESNFLVEVFFSAEADGLIVSKKRGAGYSLSVKDGKAVFAIAGKDGVEASLTSKKAVNDGKWHHLVAEADRTAKTLSIYIDGKLDSTGAGFGNVSLENGADLYVGGTPEGDWLNGTLEFMRIAHGTLADARTTIEELCAWEFDGPNRRDMRGEPVKGKARDAGALECF